MSTSTKNNIDIEIKYKHLNPETNQIMTGIIGDMIAWINQEHFVYYGKAVMCMTKLERIYNKSIRWAKERAENKKVADEKNQPIPTELLRDIRSITIIGPSGSGKSAIINQFIRNQEEKGLLFEFPVMRCLLESGITGIRGLYSAMLEPYNHPYHNYQFVKNTRIAATEIQSVFNNMLRATNTQFYFVDEFQHLNDRNTQALLNQLKRTMHIAQVPFAPVGVPETQTVLGRDMQLAKRCPVKPYSQLKYWSMETGSHADQGKDEFQEFLGGYEGYLPFPEPSHLNSDDITNLIFEATSDKNSQSPYYGTVSTREVIEYLQEATEIALENKVECLTEEVLNAVFV